MKSCVSFFRNNPLLLLIVLVLISDILILFPFISGKYIYQWGGWGYDTYHSYVPLMEMFSKNLSENTLYGLSFQYGLGTDIFAGIVIILNPISLLISIIAALVKTPNIIPDLLILYPLLTSIFSGCAIYVFLKDKLLSKKSLILSSYMYALSGYFVSTGTHYWFSLFVVYFPILLYSIDLCFEKEKTNLFLIMVFVISFLATAYGAFPMFIVSAIYIIYKTILCNKNTFKIWVKLARNAVLGVMCSSAFFFPFLYEISSVSNRMDDQGFMSKIKMSFSIVSKNELISAFLRLFSNNLQGGVDNFTGEPGPWFSCFTYFFSVAFVFLFVQYIRLLLIDFNNKKNIVILSFLLILRTSIITYIFVGLFNMYSNNYWRMAFLFLPFWALISGKTFDLMLIKHNFSHILNICCCFLTFIILFFLKQNGYITVKKIYFATVAFVFIFCFVLEMLNSNISISSKRIQSIICCIFVICVYFNYFIDHRYSVIEGASTLQKQKNHEYYYDETLSSLIEKFDNDEFVRVEKTYFGKGADSTWSMTNGCRTLSTYDSTLNKYLMDYFDNMVYIGQPNTNLLNFISYTNKDYLTYFDSARMSLLGVKYIATTSERNLSNWNMLDSKDGFYEYENSFIDTAGVLFDKWLTQEEYEKLNIYEKSVVENQCVILDLDDKNIDNDLLYIKTEIPKEKIECLNVDNYDSDDTQMSYYVNNESEITFNVTRDKIINSRDVIYLNFDSSISSQIDIEIYSEQLLFNKLYTISADNNELVVLLDEDAEKVVMKFHDIGKITINEIDIINSPITFSTNCTFTNNEMGNIVEGNTEYGKDAYLFLPIPYQSGWKAYVDGKVVPIMKANYAFMAIRLNKGSHEIVLEYHNPVLKISVLTSFFSILISIFIIYIEKGEVIKKEK